MRRRRTFRWPFRDATRIREDVEAEIEHHLELSEQALERAGLAREAAWREARQRFGDVSRAKRELQAMDRRHDRSSQRRAWWGDLWRDLRHGARVLRRRPGFAALAVGTLTVGIGGTAAIFEIVSGLMLRPLPYAAEDRIVAFWEPGQWSAAEFELAREVGESFSALAGWAWDGRTLGAVKAPHSSQRESWPRGACSRCWARVRSWAAPADRRTAGRARRRSSC